MTDWAHNYSDVNLTLIGFGLFLAVFVGAIVLTFHKDRKEHFEQVQTLPLEEGGLQ